MPPERAYRIGDPSGEFAVFSPEGAKKKEGRWHSTGQEVIYASNYYSTALLEARAYIWKQPDEQRFVEVKIDPDISFEMVDPNTLNDWNLQDSMTAREFGSLWLEEQRTAILIVPSVLAPIDHNVLFNPNHPDAQHCWQVSREYPVKWDSRLF